MIAVARLAIAIGLAGLVPFILAASSLFIWPEHGLMLVNYFFLYSAGILAFMAGVYWPIALQLENRAYPMSPLSTMLISQVFFLIAGIGLLLPVALQMVIYPLAFLGLYFVDVRWMTLYWPDWYRRMRMMLTGMAVVTQLIVATWLLTVQ
jgi:hypothetical protein